MTKILLVEDDKSLREIYGVRLLAEGYDIISAGDGEEALAMAIKERPSLILSDVMMPKISGFDMLDILRSTTETHDIKVIMMTALSSEDQRKRGEQLGADRYLVKSQVGIEDVVRTVHEVLGDAPTAADAANMFAAPSQTAAAPQAAAPAPAAQPQPQQPPMAPPQPAAAPAPTPLSGPQPVAAPPAPAAPQPSTLPQPTAPLAASRTGNGDTLSGNLASRVIQPIERPETNEPAVSDLMEQELNGNHVTPNPFSTDPIKPDTSDIDKPILPPVPESASRPDTPPAAPPQQPQQNPAPAPAAPMAPSGPQPAPAPMSGPQQPVVPNSSVDYEETPRPAAPAPQPGAMPTPPAN